MMSKLFFLSTASALVLKSKQPFGDKDDAYVDDKAARNAMFDCSGGVAAAKGKTGGSNSMATRVLQAKAAAIAASDDSQDFASFSDSVKNVNKFARHAAQDAEQKEDPVDKKKMSNGAPYVHRKNFHGPDTDVEAANEATKDALAKAVSIRQDYFGEQFYRGL